MSKYGNRYPKELEGYVLKHSLGKTNQKLADMANKRFGLRMTARTMSAYRKNHHLPPTGLTGRFEKGHPSPNKGIPMPKSVYEKVKATMFKKGQKPWNDTFEIGDRRLIYWDHRKRRAYYEKVSRQGGLWDRWKPLSRLTLQRAGREVPEDCVVYHVNKDTTDDRLENLAIVNKSQCPYLSRMGLISDDPETMKASELLAALSSRRYAAEAKARKARKKERRKCLKTR